MSGTNPLTAALLDLIDRHRVALLDLDQALAERDSYRLLSQQAIHRLADVDAEIRRLREQHRRVVEEFRTYRAATICTPGRAA